MARLRDHKADYQRRIARAEAKGLSRSQARGHARVGEVSARPHPLPPRQPGSQFEVALKSLRRTGSLSAAAKIAGISSERFRRELGIRGLAERAGRRWRVTDADPRHMTVYTTDGAKDLYLGGIEPTSLAGEHRVAVKAFRDSNDPSHLAPFIGRSVTDMSDRLHLLETDPNALYELIAEREGFPEIYRFVS